MPLRCGICSRESVWAACDVFWRFDFRGCGEISRADFIRGVAERPTVDKLRFMRRADMEARLRSSVKPLLLQEYLQAIWPRASVKLSVPNPLRSF